MSQTHCSLSLLLLLHLVVVVVVVVVVAGRLPEGSTIFGLQRFGGLKVVVGG